MLIVAGTVLWAEGMESLGEKNENIKIMNTTPIVMNGSLKHEYDKQVEGGDITGYPNINLKNWSPRPSKNIFDVGNVRFAIDVCADTSTGQAKKYYYSRDPEGCLGGSGVDVHLIVSNSSGVANTIARPGGYILVTDSAYLKEGNTQDPKGGKPSGMTSSILQNTGTLIKDHPLFSTTTAKKEDVSPNREGIYRGIQELPPPVDFEEQRQELNRRADNLLNGEQGNEQNLIPDFRQIGKDGRDHHSDLLRILAWARANHPDRISSANKVVFDNLMAKTRQLGDKKASITNTTSKGAQFISLIRLSAYVLSQLKLVHPGFKENDADEQARKFNGYDSLAKKVKYVKDTYSKDLGYFPDLEQEQILDILAYALFHLDHQKKGKPERLEGMKSKFNSIITVEQQSESPNIEIARYTLQKLNEVSAKRKFWSWK